MSDGLSLPTSYYTAPNPSERPSWLSVAARAATMLAVFAGAGIGGGYAWRHLWTPPAGEAVNGSWVPTPVEEGLQSDFSGVGWYVVVALGLGLLVGLVTAVVLNRTEVVALGVTLLGSALAAYLVLTTGERLSPPDPDEVAATAEDGDEIVGDLEFDGWTPLLSCPVGALVSLSTVYLLTTRRGGDPGGGGNGHAGYALGPYSPHV